MSSQKEQKSSGIVKVNPDEQSVDLSSLIPLGQQFLENSHKEAQAAYKIQKESLELDKQKLYVEQSTFRFNFGLLVFVTIVILMISVGLIFMKDDVSTGMSLLSHLGAMIAGIIAGVGWVKV